MGDFRRKCIVCGGTFWPLTERGLECNSCWNAKNKRPSARAEPQLRTWSYEDIKAAFNEAREEEQDG